MSYQGSHFFAHLSDLVGIQVDQVKKKEDLLIDLYIYFQIYLFDFSLTL